MIWLGPLACLRQVASVAQTPRPHWLMLQAELAYLTASAIVALAEMVGSTVGAGWAAGMASTGSARRVDMTAHQTLEKLLAVSRQLGPLHTERASCHARQAVEFNTARCSLVGLITEMVRDSCLNSHC